MAIVYSGKSFSGVMNDTANYYYTDADCNAKIGAGEKFYVELRATNVVSTPQITVGLESSNDNVNWASRNAAIIATTSISSGTVLTGAETGGTTVGGRFQRFTLKLSSGTSPGAYIELWVTARNAF